MADIVYPGQMPGGVLGRGFMPSNYDIEVYRGDFIPMTLTLRDSNNVVMNLTGYTAKASIRSSYDDATAYLFTVTITPAAGRIDLVLTSAVSATMDPGSYIWDMQITDPSGNVRTLIAGDVTVYNEVTK